jgi:hypothetical protein
MDPRAFGPKDYKRECEPELVCLICLVCLVCSVCLFLAQQSADEQSTGLGVFFSAILHHQLRPKSSICLLKLHQAGLSQVAA